MSDKKLSLKKEIMQALNSESADVKINNISYLTRYTKDYAGNDTDVLRITFKYLAGYKGGWNTDIKSRDYDEILKEIDTATREYFKKCADAMYSNMKAGLR